MKHPGNQRFEISLRTAVAIAVVATSALTALPAGAAKGGKAGTSSESSVSLDCATTVGYSDEGTTGSMYNVNRMIGADLAWARGFTGAGIDVALIDTGTVPVTGLGTDKVIDGPDLSFDSPIPELRSRDTFGHGTHMAGIIAGNDVDRKREKLEAGEFQGVAPDARIVNVKVADSTGAVDVSQIIAGIDWVVEHRNANGMNIRVINLSYRTASTQDYSIDPLTRAVENAWEHGIVVVVAAGNDGRRQAELGNPARDPFVIAVGSLRERFSQDSTDGALPTDTDNCIDAKQRWRRGTETTRVADETVRQPDLYAPGTTIVSLRSPGSRIDTENPTSVIADRYTKGTGSSQAAAVVSGAVAVLLEARPGLSPGEVKSVLVATAQTNVKETFSLIDLEAALDEPVPADATQTWLRSTGTGTLDASRGTDHVTINGEELVGQNTVFGSFDGDGWLAAEATGASWSGTSWSGTSWSGSSWSGSSWS